MNSDIDYSKLPEHIRQAAKLYIEKKVKPGSFLSAVISNKLVESFAQADDINRSRLFDIAGFFYDEAPSRCWGSEEKMKLWIERRAENESAFGQEGIREQLASSI